MGRQRWSVAKALGAAATRAAAVDRGNAPPDIEEMLRRSQDKIKRFLPSGGSGKGMALIGILVDRWLADHRFLPRKYGSAGRRAVIWSTLDTSRARLALQYPSADWRGDQTNCNPRQSRRSWFPVVNWISPRHDA